MPRHTAFPLEVLPVLVSYIVAQPDGQKARQALHQGLFVCRDWLPVFEEALWREINLSDVTNHLERIRDEDDDSTCSSTAGSSEPGSEGDTSEPRKARVQAFLLALEAATEKQTWTRSLTVASKAEAPLLVLFTRLTKLTIGHISTYVRIQDLGVSSWSSWPSVEYDWHHPGWPHLSAPLPLDRLTQLSCTNTDPILVFVLLSRAPSLKLVHVHLGHAETELLWSRFTYDSLPPIEQFHFDNHGAICQSMLDRVLVPLATTLQRLWLNVMDEGAPDVDHVGPGVADCWTGWPDLVFPRLRRLGLATVSLAGAAALIRKAPMLEHLSLRYCFEDCDEAAVLRTLAPTLRSVTWWATGDPTYVAETYAQCIEDPSWLPELNSCPDFRLVYGWTPGDSYNSEMKSRILHGLRRRHITVSSQQEADMIRATDY